MEAYPLNLAHQQYRRAEAHLKSNRYDEAMQCHQKAAELLLDAMKSTTSTFALESISLQHSYHLKQKDLIKSKKEQFARVKKAMENIKCLGIDPNYVLDKDHNKLQIAIYKAINESETLLQKIYNNEDETDAGVIPKDIEGKKKDPQIVVEELQTLSKNLYSLIDQLVLQVEVLKDENMTLKDKVNYLENERKKYLNISSQGELNYSCDLPGISAYIENYTQESNKTLETDFSQNILKEN